MRSIRISMWKDLPKRRYILNNKFGFGLKIIDTGNKKPF
jgi:hypothetical protein